MFREINMQLIASVVIRTGFEFVVCIRILFLLLFEVAQLNAPSPSDAAERRRIHFPVFNGIGKQADYGVLVLLHAGMDGAKVIDADLADFVAVEENHLHKDTFSLPLSQQTRRSYLRL